MNWFTDRAKELTLIASACYVSYKTSLYFGWRSETVLSLEYIIAFTAGYILISAFIHWQKQITYK